MPDSKKLRGKPDRSRINIGQRHELAYWTRKLNISTIALVLACMHYRAPTVANVKRRLSMARAAIRRAK